MNHDICKEKQTLRYPQLTVVLDCGTLESRGLLTVFADISSALPRLDEPNVVLLGHVSYIPMALLFVTTRLILAMNY